MDEPELPGIPPAPPGMMARCDCGHSEFIPEHKLAKLERPPTGAVGIHQTGCIVCCDGGMLSWRMFDGSLKGWFAGEDEAEAAGTPTVLAARIKKASKGLGRRP